MTREQYALPSFSSEPGGCKPATRNAELTR
jgi:hypothetical protein